MSNDREHRGDFAEGQEEREDELDTGSFAEGQGDEEAHREDRDQGDFAEGQEERKHEEEGSFAEGDDGG